MPAPRRRIRQNWPIGLYETKAKGSVYYRWRDPNTRKFHGLGADFDVARTVAAQRNADIAKAPVQKYLDKLTDSAPSVLFSEACKAFLADLKNRKTGRGDDVRPRSASTIRDYGNYCRRFQEHFGEDALIGKIDLRQVSDYLDSYGTKFRARNMARGLLSQIWTLAISKGWAKENVPEQTLKLTHGVKRKRLTVPQYESVLAAAEPWFSAACRFATFCDQRREDVSTVEAAGWKNGSLSFEQEKTGHVVHVKAGPRLTQAIEDCLANGPRTVKTIIRKPGRRQPVSDDMLTKTFSRIRNRLIAKKHDAWKGYKLKSEGKPTWHELRSLGTHFADVADKDSKSLAGHATEEMNAEYKKGHKRVFHAESL